MSNIDLLVSSLNSKFANPQATSQQEIKESIHKLTINVQTIDYYASGSVTVVTKLLGNIKALILSGNQLDSYSFSDDEIFALLAGLIKVCDFETVVSKVFSQQDVLDALMSDVVLLMRIACSVLVKSYGTYLDPAIYAQLSTAYFSADADIGVLTEIEATYSALRNAFAPRMLEETLPEIKSFPDLWKQDTSFSRLIALFEIFFDYNTVPVKTNLFFDWSLHDLYCGNIINFMQYSKFVLNVLKIIRSTFPYHPNSFEAMKDLLFQYGKLYSKMDEEYSLVRNFAETELYKIFEQISFIDQNFMSELDSKYIHVGETLTRDLQFYAFLDPKYLMEYQKDTIQGRLELTPKYLAVVRNLISTQPTFDFFIKDRLLGNIQMPYLEQLVLIEKLSQYEYSSRFLLEHCARLSSNLIDNKDITDLEAKELKQQCLSNFLRYSDEVLTIWKVPLMNALKLLRGNIISEAQPIIEEIAL
ncbi:hypothetical protein ACO0QE_004078 [Hanseniaspora vineae]